MWRSKYGLENLSPNRAMELVLLSHHLFDYKHKFVDLNSLCHSRPEGERKTFHLPQKAVRWEEEVSEGSLLLSSVKFSEQEDCHSVPDTAKSQCTVYLGIVKFLANSVSSWSYPLSSFSTYPFLSFPSPVLMFLSLFFQASITLQHRLSWNSWHSSVQSAQCYGYSYQPPWPLTRQFFLMSSYVQNSTTLPI